MMIDDELVLPPTPTPTTEVVVLASWLIELPKVPVHIKQRLDVATMSLGSIGEYGVLVLRKELLDNLLVGEPLECTLASECKRIGNE